MSKQTTGSLTELLAALRKQFGGHPVRQAKR